MSVYSFQCVMCMQQPLDVTKDFQPYYMPNTPAPLILYVMQDSE